MVTLDLTPEERSELAEVIASVLSDLRMEVSATDRLEFREKLKRREQLLARVQAALEAR